MAKERRNREKARVQPTERAQRLRLLELVGSATAAIGAFDPESTSLTVTGSGVVVHASGIAVTAKHVVVETRKRITDNKLKGQLALIITTGASADPAQPRAFTLDYTIASFSEWSFHRAYDLAVIRFKPKGRITALSVEPKVNPREGDRVITCGYPYGVALHPNKIVAGSFLHGHVSAVMPHAVVPPDQRLHYLLQLPVNPGNSGGPVVDQDTGKVCGIVSRRYEPLGTPSGLCVAEPIIGALPVIQSLSKKAAGVEDIAPALGS